MTRFVLPAEPEGTAEVRIKVLQTKADISAPDDDPVPAAVDSFQGGC